MKQLGIFTLVILFVLSVGVNIYGLAYPWVHRRGVREGADALHAEIIRQYQQAGQLRMVINGNTVVFVPKVQTQKPIENKPKPIEEKPQ